MIANITKNIMGTASFDGQFSGMRKPQNFIVYPIKSGDEAASVKVQSDTRIGLIDLLSGLVVMSKSYPSGAYNPHLATATPAGKLTAEELFMLKSSIFATASGKAGSSSVITDNSGAFEVFA